MEQKKSRKDKAADTKKRIFETSVALIKSKGYDNVTISEICKAAGLAKAMPAILLLLIRRQPVMN